MTATKEQIVAEAERRWENELGEREWSVVDYIIEVIREGWKPPEPVDPDVPEYWEWVAAGGGETQRAAFLAGARMAREQEQERAKGLVEYLDEASGFLGHFIPESAALKARNILAAYKAGRAAR
jgi:hypothetical protein